MITDGEKGNYLAVKKLSALLKGITSSHKVDFYCLNCFHSHNTANKLKKHKNVCRNDDCCYVEMPKEDNKVLKHNQGEKSMKVAYTTCADLEYLSTCYNNPKKSSTTKINKHAASGYSLLTYCSSNTRKNKLDCYSGKDCMERFSKDLKKYSTKIINYEKKKKWCH